MADDHVLTEEELQNTLRELPDCELADGWLRRRRNGTNVVALEDESHEVRMLAAWTLVKLDKPKQALACLDELLFDGTTNQTMLHNVLDWMGEPALPTSARRNGTASALMNSRGVHSCCRI